MKPFGMLKVFFSTLCATMGVFDLKLAPSDPGTFTGTVKKDQKEVSFTAVLIK